MSQIFFTRTCPRCSNEIQYISPSYFARIQHEDLDHCKICKIISDINLKPFVEQNQYSRPCPECGKIICYKHRNSFRQAIIKNCPCKSCVNKHTQKRKSIEMEKQWLPIIGRWPVEHNTFILIRTHWGKMSDEDQKKLMSKSVLQKKYYWGHLRRKNHREGNRKVREIFAEKYSGENHWMKRPEVLDKVRETCKKFRGDNHWFRKNKDKL